MLSVMSQSCDRLQLSMKPLSMVSIIGFANEEGGLGSNAIGTHSYLLFSHSITKPDFVY